MKRVFQYTLGVLALLVVPSSAFAHPMKGVGDFYAGMLHPVVTIEMILPLIALGLFAGQQRRETAISVLAAFPAAILAGTFLTFIRPIPSFIGTATLAITAVIGILIALSKPLVAAVSIAMAVLLGLAIGWYNASEITPQMSPVRFVAGLAVAGLLVATYGVGLVRTLKVAWAQVAVRVAGSWLAAIGILVVGLR
jgi:urease accessory protein